MTDQPHEPASTRFTVAGSEYRAQITVGSAIELKEETGFDVLVAPRNQGFGATLLPDPILLGAVLWSLCGDQHEGVEKKQFLKGLAGAELHAGFWALADALVFFIRATRGDRPADALEKLIEAEVESLDSAAKGMQRTLESRREELIETMEQHASEEADAAIDRAIKDQKEKKRGTGSGGSRAKSGSTRDR